VDIYSVQNFVSLISMHFVLPNRNGDALAIKTLEIYVIVLNFDVNPAVQN